MVCHQLLVVFLSLVCLAHASAPIQPAPHPRLHLLDKDLPLVHAAIATDSVAASYYQRLLTIADELLLHNSTVSWNPGSILEVSRTALLRISVLAGIYRLTGNTSYAERAILEMRAAAAFPEWDPMGFLDTAEMTNAMSIGYDWMYDVISDTDKQTFETAIYEKGFHFGLEFYTGNYTKDPAVSGAWDWTKADFNWNQVCNGGLMVGAIALWEVYPDTAQQILAYALKSLPIALASYGPDGGWVEGPMYWGYATKYFSYAVGSALSAFGTDFGLLEAFPAIKLTGNFRIHELSPIYLWDNYGDCLLWTDYEFEMIFLGRLLNNSLYLAHERMVTSPNTGVGDVPSILHLFYSRAEDSGLSFPPSDLPLDSYFRYVEVVTFRTTWDMGLWRKSYWYGALKGGDTTQNHQDLDLGTFIVEKDGVRFIEDLGGDNYGLPGYFQIPSRYQYYRTNTSGHNTLTFNGAYNNQQITQAQVTNFTSTDEQVYARLNLTSAYQPNATSVFREMTFDRTQEMLTITDTILKNENTKSIFWRFHTQANVTISGNKLLLTSGGANLTATLLTPSDASWDVYPYILLPPFDPANLTVVQLELSAQEQIVISVQFA